MSCLVEIADVNRALKALETACKALESTKAEYECKLDNILEINLICVDKDDLVEFCNTRISELESARNELFEMYMSLSSGLQ